MRGLSSSDIFGSFPTAFAATAEFLLDRIASGIRPAAPQVLANTRRIRIALNETSKPVTLTAMKPLMRDGKEAGLSLRVTPSEWAGTRGTSHRLQPSTSAATNITATSYCGPNRKVFWW